MSPPLRAVGVGLAAAATLAIAACSAPPAAAPKVRSGPVVRSTEPTIYAVRGKPIVVPLTATAEPPESVEVTFGDGPPQRVPLFWVQVDPRRIPIVEGDAQQAAARWLVWRNRWSVAPPRHATRPGARGFLALLVSPEGGGEPDSVRIGGARYGVKWIPPLGGIELPPLRAPDSDLLDAAHRLLRDDPTQRWRAELYRPADVRPFVGRRDDGRDPLLEALANQIAARWRFALSRLSRADADLAARLAAHLGGVVVFDGLQNSSAVREPGQSVALPCPVQDPIGEETLLRNLLSDRLTDAEKVGAAQAWLSARRRALVWVIDDASTSTDGPETFASTIAVANLDGVPIAASVETAADTEILTVPSGAATAIHPAVDDGAADVEDRLIASLWGVPEHLYDVRADAVERARLAGRGLEVPIRAGGAAFTRRVYALPTPATPPGAALGPLTPEWNAPRFMEAGTIPGASSLPRGFAKQPALPEDRLTVGMLYREAAAAEKTTSTTDSSEVKLHDRWTVYLECATAPPPNLTSEGGLNASSPTREMRSADAVRLWFGPFGDPTLVLRIGRDGVVIDETTTYSTETGDAAPAGPQRGLAAAPGIGEHVRLVREADRWILWADVPSGVVGDDGLLRLGIERTDARGERTTWPRPVLPWQREPGRAVIDLTTWGELGL